MAKVKKIRALFGLSKIPDGSLTPLLHNSLKGLMDHSTLFPKPPVELPVYQNGIGAFETAIPPAIDGGKAAVALKNQLREVVVKMYGQQAHYVEANCNDDMATFLLSGFQAAPLTKAPAQVLATPAIVSVVPGPITGQQKVKFGTDAKAITYQLQYAVVPNGVGAPLNWTVLTLASSKPAIVGNLTPGTMYTFQVRALGRLGFTDWSDPVNRMAT